MLYRATRELLHNVVKHARAHTARISVRRSGRFIEIAVEDDGVGLHASTAGKRFSAQSGFGLFSIREGLDHAGGRFELETLTGRGTRAVMLAPLARTNGNGR